MKIKKNINFGNYSKKISVRRSFICGVKGTILSKREIRFLKKYKPWGIILFERNIKSINQTKILVDNVKKLFGDTKYPVLVDEEGGRVSRFKKIIDTSSFSAKFFANLYKNNIKKFKIYSEVYINQISYIFKLIGINHNTIPVLDLYRKNSHKIIGDRSYSNNPKIVKKIGNIFLNKFNKNQINTIIKHIPGHGLAKVDSHKALPIVKKDINYLLKNDFETFKNHRSLIAMTGHILYQKIDRQNCATHSKKVISVIRKKIGFKNILLTDDISMKALKDPINISTLKSFSAGCNIVLHCNGKLSEMKKVAENSPFLSKFVIKKTSQIARILS